MPSSDSEAELPRGGWRQIRRLLLGKPRDVKDPHLGHKLSLIAFLAWVGLGADGLSSSAYGPEEAFIQLGQHTYLAILLAVAAALTVFIISYAYRRIIEHFPHGGGGYVVSTELLGAHAGVISGCALLVDYVLTITVSVAGGGDALFSVLPLHLQRFKLTTEFAAIIVLLLLNLRGIKESVVPLVPIFLTFLLTHAILIVGGIVSHLGNVPEVAHHIHTGFREGGIQLGKWGMFVLFLRAYSLGGGTYTGIEAVSNGLGIMREPKVETGKRTMTYMATSLALTAAGLILCYLLFHVQPVEGRGRTLNAILSEQFASHFQIGSLPVGRWFIAITMLSESVLLLVAAQTGFIDGPRVMSFMAVDSWLPRRFALLSERFTVQNGVLLIGGAALAALAYTHGNTAIIVVMYSINVFATFSLSETGMVRFWIRHRKSKPEWKKHLPVHATGLVLCFSILCVMLIMKFTEGGWITLAITFVCIVLCFMIRRHYRKVGRLVRRVEESLEEAAIEAEHKPAPQFDPTKPTAIVLVGGSARLGVHCLLTIARTFPKTFHNFVFVSVGVIDSGYFKGAEHLEDLEKHTKENLAHYVEVARRLGLPARSAYRIGTDVVDEASSLCVELAKQYYHAVIFAGEVVFDEPGLFDGILHNDTSYAIQRRLRFAGLPVMILPVRLHRRKTSR
jgi:amino acid transporter